MPSPSRASAGPVTAGYRQLLPLTVAYPLITVPTTEKRLKYRNAIEGRPSSRRRATPTASTLTSMCYRLRRLISPCSRHRRLEEAGRDCSCKSHSTSRPGCNGKVLGRAPSPCQARRPAQRVATQSSSHSEESACRKGQCSKETA